MSAIREFQIAVPQEQLDDLHRRLDQTRLPEAETVDDWSQGLPLATTRRFLDHWRNHYDWRRCEALVNGWPQYVTEIGGLDIHFLHIRSPEPDARPLLMTHGWPGSVVEFFDIIGPLTDPVAHGGKAEDAFHLILPTLPGYGFSGKPTGTGWGVERIARAWAELMDRLGYDRWFAQGGDWGSIITTTIGAQAPAGCAGIHITLATLGKPPPEVLKKPNRQELRSLRVFEEFRKSGSGYSEIQRTKPQTIGYALADSAVGQMAWIVEKFAGWSDGDAEPDDEFAIDRLLDNVMFYWLTNSAASAARLYWESFGAFDFAEITLPSALSVFPGEIIQPSQRWAETRYRNLVYYNNAERGGHFAAMQVPELFVNEVRSAFGMMTLG